MGLSCRGTELQAGLAVIAAVALTLSAAGPAAAIDQENVLGPATDGCPEEWWGVGGSGGASNRACVHVEAELPRLSKLVDLLSTDVDHDECPEDFAGAIVERDGSIFGVCYRIFYQLPEEPWVVVGADLSACEMPDREGEDPVIFIADGAVGFCVVPIIEPGPAAPDVDVSTEPCEPQTTDPEVRVAGGGVRVCLDVSLYGLGNPQLNLVIAIFDDLREEVPPYIPTP